MYCLFVFVFMWLKSLKYARLCFPRVTVAMFDRWKLWTTPHFSPFRGIFCSHCFCTHIQETYWEKFIIIESHFTDSYIEGKMCWLKDAPFFVSWKYLITQACSFLELLRVGLWNVENTGKQGCREDKPAGYYHKITSQVDDRVEFPLKARLIKLSLEPNKKLGFLFFLEWIFKKKKNNIASHVMWWAEISPSQKLGSRALLGA